VVDGRERTAGSGVGCRSDCRQEDHGEEDDAWTRSCGGYRRGVDWHRVCVGVEHEFVEQLFPLLPPSVFCVLVAVLKFMFVLQKRQREARTLISSLAVFPSVEMSVKLNDLKKKEEEREKVAATPATDTAVVYSKM
jgi:hypothetical protein